MKKSPKDTNCFTVLGWSSREMIMNEKFIPQWVFDQWAVGHVDPRRDYLRDMRTRIGWGSILFVTALLSAYTLHSLGNQQKLGADFVKIIVITTTMLFAFVTIRAYCSSYRCAESNAEYFFKAFRPIVMLVRPHLTPRSFPNIEVLGQMIDDTLVNLATRRTAYQDIDGDDSWRSNLVYEEFTMLFDASKEFGFLPKKADFKPYFVKAVQDGHVERIKAEGAPTVLNRAFIG